MATDLVGGSYCGRVRYRVTEAPKVFGACHCRPCQYIAGGGPNDFLLVPRPGFAFEQGTLQAYRRDDLEVPVTREFCPTCGTHMITRLPGRGDMVVKVGTLDNPAQAGAVGLSIHCEEAAPFHLFAGDARRFDTRPSASR